MVVSPHWNEFLYFAIDLVGQPDPPIFDEPDNPPGFSDETRLRVAVSRVYYACYWKARQHAEKEGSNEKSHTRVASYFMGQRRVHEDRWHLGWTLDQLRTSRESADYDNPPGSDWDSTWHTCLKNARRVFDIVDELPVHQS